MAIDERGVNLKVTATNETQQGFEGVKQSAREMANTVTQESGRASQSVGKIGDGADRAARAYGRFEAEIRRKAAAVQAALEGTGRAGEIANKALAQGLDVAKLEPSLAKLRELEAALNTGGAQLDKYGMSAKQTAAALRGVPAQLTDIFVSLQGGQRPMTVLIQQGGQLKDMFGGIVPAARALGTTFMGMVNPLTLAAAAVGGLYMAYRTGAVEAERFHATLVMTGNAAGTSVENLQNMSARIGDIVGTQRQAAAALNEFAKSGKIGSDSLQDFTVAAIRWSDATGTAVSDVVKQFEELAKDPLGASVKLNESMNHLTSSVYEQIRSLKEQGRHTEAARVAQVAFADSINDRTPKIVGNLGLVEKGWRGIKSAISEAVSAVAEFGRSETLEDRLAQELEKLRESPRKSRRLFG